MHRAPEGHKKKMATALIECPCGTAKRKQVVARQIRPVVVVGGR
jgi:hypothetical protein